MVLKYHNAYTTLLVGLQMKHAKQMVASTEYLALVLNKAYNLVILRQQINTVLIIGLLV